MKEQALSHALIELVSVPVALCVLFLMVHEWAGRLPGQAPQRRLLLGAYAVLLLATMLLGVEVVPGVHIDARNGVVAVATLALGAAGGLGITLVGVLLRLALGGVGMWPGAIGLLAAWALAVACGAAARRLQPAQQAWAKQRTLALAGLGAGLAAVGPLVWLDLQGSLPLRWDQIMLCSASPFITTGLLGGLIQWSASRSQAIRNTRHVNHRLRQSLRETVGALSAAILHSDPAGAAQQRRVADLAQAIGRRLGLDEHRLEGLELAALVHDVGQIDVPGEILARPGPLTPAEYALVQLHPSIGHDILKDIDFPWPLAEMVHQHHENMDGSGYPRGLQGEQICLEARILRVCDIVEAMSSHRVYRAAIGREQALQEIERLSGRKLDAQVVSACLALFRENDYQLPRH